MSNDLNIISIDGKKVGKGEPPFIIAELSGNHNGSIDRALALIEAAAESGADAIKLQTYTPDTMTLDLSEGDFKITDKNSLWYGRSLYDLYSEAYTPWEWHEELFKKAESLGLIFMSSPFDKSSVDFLESLNVPCYKVASFESNDLPLVKYIASKGKPMIISTGMSSVAEIDETVQAAKEAGCNELILLKCTSTYPATPETTNISTIPHMRELFGCPVGLSDHTNGIGVAVASIALGSAVIEKHFTMDRSDGGVDSVFSLEPSELKQLVDNSHIAYKAMGQIFYGQTNLEQKSAQFRRSIYFVNNLKKGDVVKETDIRIIRPGYGLAPKYFEVIVGRSLSKDVKIGTAVHWNCF